MKMLNVVVMDSSDVNVIEWLCLCLPILMRDGNIMSRIYARNLQKKRSEKF